eukprot:scaffold40843_cov21-Prasinocladus_malaysianus.AAC.1
MSPKSKAEFNLRSIQFPLANCLAKSVQEAELPALAVASGCNVFIFRNLRPYYKFVIPAEEAHPEEKKIWSVILDKPSLTASVSSRIET